MLAAPALVCVCRRFAKFPPFPFPSCKTFILPAFFADHFPVDRSASQQRQCHGPEEPGQGPLAPLAAPPLALALALALAHALEAFAFQPELVPACTLSSLVTTLLLVFFFFLLVLRPLPGVKRRMDGDSNHRSGPGGPGPLPHHRSNARVDDAAAATAIATEGEEMMEVDGIGIGIGIGIGNDNGSNLNLNLDGDGDCKMAEEDEDAMDGALPLPGSAMDEDQQQEVCITNM